MYLIQALMTSQIPTIPSSLPPWVRASFSSMSTPTPRNVSSPPPVPLRNQATGPLPPALRAQQTGSRSPVSSAFPSSTGSSSSYQGRVQPQYTGQSQLSMGRQGAPNLPARPVSSALGGAAFGSGSGAFLTSTPSFKARSLI